MRHSKESRDLVLQNEKKLPKSQKHDANLQKNSTLYFQVGLILCLLASYAGLEMQFEKTLDTYSSSFTMDEGIVEIAMDDFKIYEEPVKEVKQKVQKKAVVIKDKIKVVDNEDKVVKETLETLTEAPPTHQKQVISTHDSALDVEKPIEDFTILTVQKVPVYPGCEKETNNDARRKCMSEKIGKHIRRKFNGNLAQDLGLSSGTKKIDVLFKINTQGEVEIVKTRAPHPRLEKEAMRVINKMPKIIPGMYNKTPVNVLYTVPIKFNVQN